MPTPTDHDFREQCLLAARRAGDWFVNTQVPNYKWRRTADEGRFWYNYYRPYRNGHRSTVWTTATAAMSLLALHRRTGEEKYRTAARQGIEYLKTIQILDGRDQRVFGAFHEHTMRTEFIYPRDAVTGAWGMLSLYVYEGRKEEDLLYRSRIFADWLWRSAWDSKRRWILREYNLETHQADRRLCNFQSGSGVWFYHLYRVTGEERYLKDGLLPLADLTLEMFLSPEGQFRLEYDPEKDAWEQGTGEGMHAWNDDYVCTALLCAYQATGETKYLDRVRAFARWLLGQQNPDGSMGKTPAAAATSILLFDQLDAIRPEPELMAAARRAAGWLFANQVTDEPDVNLHGGMTDEDFTRDYVGTRTTSYALSALLKLENRANPVFYSVEDFLGTR